MKVTFIHHSGFFIETEKVCFLFDYWQGKLPQPLNKPLLVFASHSHKDHFTPMVFEYGRRWQDTRYILSKDIFQSRIPEDLKEQVTFVAPQKTYEFTAGDMTVSVNTLRSTDQGCAFLVRMGNKTLYHAGDLHLWLWRECEEDDRAMQAAFEANIEPLRGLVIDAAFLPLDPRQEPEDRFLGVDYTARLADLRRIYPMHCWEELGVIDELFNHSCSEPYRNKICLIRKDGYTDEI